MDNKYKLYFNKKFSLFFIISLLYFIVFTIGCVYHAQIKDFSNGFYGSMSSDNNNNIDKIYWYCFIVIPYFMNMLGFYSTKLVFLQYLDNKIIQIYSSIRNRIKRKSNPAIDLNSKPIYLNIISVIMSTIFVLLFMVSIWYIHPTIYEIYLVMPIFGIVVFAYSIFGPISYVLLIPFYFLLPYLFGRQASKYIMKKNGI